MSAAPSDAMGAYYALRAVSYERIYAKPERQADLRALEAMLPALFTGRRVLEIACGTGWWTPHAARNAKSWLATDLNSQTLDIARTKPMPGCVQFATVDAFALQGLDGPHFDAAFAGFWWSHVPLQRLRAWLDALHQRLQPGARVVFLDNVHVQGSSTPLSRTDAHGNTYQQRALDDGSTHEVLKNFPTSAEAFARLGPRADRPQWHTVGHFWMLHYSLHDTPV